jgi:glycosyltransferase involved in cell wall biosynthesis
MKIYTCAFKPFTANEQFFARDSGLLCETLIRLGHNSKVVMPRAKIVSESDSDIVVRGSEEDLRSAQWWRGLDIDAVAFICWGFRQHTAIIRAANQAGVKTCAIIDSNCSGYPYFDFTSTIRTLWLKGKYSEPFPKCLIGLLARAMIFGIKGLYSNYYANAQACTATFAAFNSQNSQKRASKRARLFGDSKKISQLRLMGYPIPDNVNPLSQEARKSRILAIGRWDAVRHKRPHLLMAVAERVVRQNESITFDIYGRIPDFMADWFDHLPEEISQRIQLRGIVTHDEISRAISESKILYCPSASEGVPLPVVEALCGGCSVVGLGTDEVPGLAWAFSEGHGTPAKSDEIDSHVNALSEEINIWKNGERDPLVISEFWSSWFSATRYAERLVNVLST